VDVQVRKSRLAGLGLAFTLSAAAVAGVATPASAGTQSGNAGNADNASLAALVDWLSTHELQDWLNFLALTNPPPHSGNAADAAGKGVTHPSAPFSGNAADAGGKGVTHSSGSNAADR
jgi:hypothetical protein